MATTKRTVTECRCDRCSHIWLPRKGQLPTICPRCKSPHWNGGKG